MIRTLSLVLALACATLAAAQAVNIHSITPSTVPTTGGTEVTITGIGFAANCAPVACIAPAIWFGGVRALETRVINETTVVAVTPPHLPGTVTVLYRQASHAPILQNAFTFLGEPPASYPRLLLPILAPPVKGAFGSEFHTSLRMMTKLHEVQFWGLQEDRPCPILCIIPVEDPLSLVPTGVFGPEYVVYNGNPGRFFYVRQFDLRNLAANLRVHDVTRPGLNYGTEIPVVRSDEFASRVVLNAVPADPRFRLTLRIYSADAPFARVTVGNGPAMTVTLREGATIYEPNYGELTISQPEAGPFQVIVDAPVPLGMPPQPPPAETPVWAFITVTNNETQVISTITPQP